MTHLSQLEHAILPEVACATYIVQDKKIDIILYVFGQPPQWSLASAILNLAAILPQFVANGPGYEVTGNGFSYAIAKTRESH